MFSSYCAWSSGFVANSPISGTSNFPKMKNLPRSYSFSAHDRAIPIEDLSTFKSHACETERRDYCLQVTAKIRLFINYRTSDTGPTASALYRDLVRRLGASSVFIDHDRIQGGEEWPSRLRAEVELCTAMLCLIGPDWLSAQDPQSKRRRLDQSDDWVLREICRALERHVTLVPVLIEAAMLPNAQDLPGLLSGIANLQARHLRRVEWENDVVRILNEQGCNNRLVNASPVPDSDHATAAICSPSKGWRTSGLGHSIRRLLLAGREAGPAAGVARRFLNLFRDHGIAETQIQQFLPQITLEKLRTQETLIGALTKDVLDNAAKLFEIRGEWLDGVDDRIYEYRSCYKAPQRFFKDLANCNLDTDSFPVRALYDGKPLDGGADRRQPLVLLLVEKLRDLGDEEICRYIVYHDSWNWRHPPCRIQLKAMVRIMDRILHKVVPLYAVKPEILEQVLQGKRIPSHCLSGPLITDPSLEDYALSTAESRVAKECEELPAVLEYIKSKDLETVCTWPKLGLLFGKATRAKLK
jgi:hypothetical protein